MKEDARRTILAEFNDAIKCAYIRPEFDDPTPGTGLAYSFNSTPSTSAFEKVLIRLSTIGIVIPKSNKTFRIFPYHRIHLNTKLTPNNTHFTISDVDVYLYFDCFFLREKHILSKYPIHSCATLLPNKIEIISYAWELENVTLANLELRFKPEILKIESGHVMFYRDGPLGTYTKRTS